jgi:hypothetical protein
VTVAGITAAVWDVTYYRDACSRGGPTGFAFSTDAERVSQVADATAMLLDGNGDGQFSILGGIGERAHPAPSLDCKSLLYYSKRDGVRYLYLMRL